jgi:hypothetical protein
LAELDPDGLIEDTRELIAASRNLCEASRLAKDRSKRLNERATKNVAFGRARRAKRLSKKKSA